MDRAGAYEGTYLAPNAFVRYDRVKVTKVDNNTVSFVYTLKDSAQHIVIPTATFTSDTTLVFDLATNIGGSAAKYAAKGSAIIYINRLVIDGQAVNNANPLDLYNIDFEGYKK